jgi:hypothetical protein
MSHRAVDMLENTVGALYKHGLLPVTFVVYEKVGYDEEFESLLVSFLQKQLDTNGEAQTRKDGEEPPSKKARTEGSSECTEVIHV